MDPKISKKTQDLLGKIIKKPPLTDKLLAKPPFRFLHDIMTSVIKTTGVMKGLYTESEMNSENVKDKDAKIAFLQKAVDFVSKALGKQLSVKPAKVVAGHEPEKTNEFLQALAQVINSKVDNDDVIGKMNGKEEKEDKREKSHDREKSGDRRKRDEDKKGREKSEDRHKEKEDRHKDKEDRHRSKDEKHREKDDKHKEKDRDRERERESRHKSGRSRKREDDSKENDGPSKDMVNGDHKPTEAVSTRMQRPSSAKGSRRRMEAPVTFTEDVPMKKNEPTLKEDDLPPQVASRLARPSSARPAPPKRKDDIVQNEPAMRLGSGKPQNLIIDDGKDSDEDETFVVEESAPLPTEPEPQPRNPDEDDDDEDHGGLVKKIMETKKEYEQQRKTEIERPTISDAQRRKQREAVQKEIDKLRNSIQTLTRSANPLGKIMDYVQEDLDSMQKELEKWKAENKEHALALKREKAITERAVEPLKVQLTQVDQAIKDQLDLIGAVKSNIIRNDQKIEKMLRTIAKS